MGAEEKILWEGEFTIWSYDRRLGLRLCSSLSRSLATKAATDSSTRGGSHSSWSQDNVFARCCEASRSDCMPLLLRLSNRGIPTQDHARSSRPPQLAAWPWPPWVSQRASQSRRVFPLQNGPSLRNELLHAVDCSDDKWSESREFTPQATWTIVG